MKKLLIIMTVLLLIVLPLMAKNNIVVKRVNHDNTDAGNYSSKAYPGISGNSDYEWITNVTFSDIDNTTGADAGGYGDYTAITGNVNQTVSYNLSVTIQVDSNEYVSAFFDWNGNEDFTDAGEEFAVVAGTGSAGPHTVSITVPATATIGTTRMRVVLKWGGAPTSTGDQSYGEAEDYTINIAAAPAGPDAPSTFGATAVSASEIDLAWTQNGDSDNVLVAWNSTNTFGDPVDGSTYSAGNTITGGGTVLYYGSLLSYNHTSLSANTQYFYKAWSYDGAQYSIGKTDNATTDCGAVTTFPYTENFDGTWTDSPAAPNCWTVVNNDNDGYTWSQANTYISPTHSPDYAAHGMGNADDYLITPALTFSANYRMKWWDRVESSSRRNTYDVLVSTTTPDIASFTTNLGTYDCTNTSWTEHILNLNAYNGNTIYIAFHQTYSAATNYGFGIDDFSVELMPACPDPTSQDTNDITENTAAISWTAGGTETAWNIQYGATGFTLGTGTTVSGVTANPDTLTGLSASTTYDWYVQAFCNPDTSNWVGPNTFTTLDPPSAPDTPVPADMATDVDNQQVLGWTNHGNVLYVDVYMDGDSTKVANKDVTVRKVHNETTNLDSYDPGTLSYSTKYYWRVVVKNASSKTEADGAVWQYTTMADPTITSFPWTENFDATTSTPNGWVNDTSDSGEDWIFRNNAIGHGADVDHTSGSGNYAGVDDSSPHVTPTNLITPPLDISSLTTPTLEFYYWIGTDGTPYSNMYIDIWDGSWHTNVDSVTANGSWQVKSLDVTSYKSTGTKIRFRAVESTNYESDICLDDVKMYDNSSAPSAATNPSPADNATDIASDTNLTWDASTGATGYKMSLWYDDADKALHYICTNKDLGNVTSYDPSDDSVDDFTYSEKYYWIVTPYNASGDALSCPTWSFTVTADPTIDTFPYTNSFESAFPQAGWAVVDVNGTNGEWTQEATTVHPSGESPQDGTYMLRWNSYTANSSYNTRIETADCDFTSLSTVIIKYWMYHDTGYSGSPNDGVQIQVYTGGSWTNVGNPVNRYDGTTGWKQHVVDLSAYAGSTVKLGFYGISDYGNDVYIDNMWLGESKVNDNDDVLFSEVCDNNTGADDTGFIELFNKKNYVIDLSGDEIKMGTAPNYNDYTYTIPNGTIIAANGYLTIGNGASIGDFNTAWSKSLTTSTYLVGTSSLAITSGKAYAYNTTAKATIDETPATATNSREVRNKDKTWDGTTSTNDGTPGETSGGDEPLAEELVSFMAVYNAEELTVMWTTASEFNLNSWNIYRANTDNFVDANGIATLDAQGTATGSYQYSYHDDFDYITGETYYYWIESNANDGTVQLFGPTAVTINEHNDHNPPPAEMVYGIDNYPNPFNPSTTIRFALRDNEGTNAKLAIYNIKGQFVKELTNGKVEANKYYKVEWNGTDSNNKRVSSGVYFYKLTTDKKTFMKKMLLLK